MPAFQRRQAYSVKSLSDSILRITLYLCTFVYEIRPFVMIFRHFGLYIKIYKKLCVYS